MPPTLRSTRGRAEARELSEGPVSQDDTQAFTQGDMTLPAVPGEQAVHKSPPADLAQNTEIEKPRGRKDQREVKIRTDHGSSPLGTRRVRRDLSLDSGSRRYSVEDDVQTAWEAVYETKTMVSNVNKNLLLIMQRLEHLEERENHAPIPNQESDEYSEDPNPLAKGKNIDIRNWGNTGIPDNELDVNAQRVILAEIERSRHEGPRPHNEGPSALPEIDPDIAVIIGNGSHPPETTLGSDASRERLRILREQYDLELGKLQSSLQSEAKANEATWYLQVEEPARNVVPAQGNEHIASTPMSHDIENFVNRAGAVNSVPLIQPLGVLKPSDQLPANSMLGQYFNHPNPDGDDPDDGNGPSGDNPKGNPDPDRNADDVRLGNHASQGARYKQLAPTLPDKYHGDADVMKYHKYITQCERLCREANLPKHDQVVKCATTIIHLDHLLSLLFQNYHLPHAFIHLLILRIPYLCLPHKTDLLPNFVLGGGIFLAS